MNTIHRIESWGDRHHPVIFDFVRIALGVFLLLKGLAFMENTADLKSMITTRSDIAFSPALLIAAVYYVTFVHMVGGTLVALGIFTRLSCIVQIPVVFAAVFFVNVLESPLNSELWASITALVLLVAFSVLGSGRLSFDAYLKNESASLDDAPPKA